MFYTGNAIIGIGWRPFVDVITHTDYQKLRDLDDKETDKIDIFARTGTPILRDKSVIAGVGREEPQPAHPLNKFNFWMAETASLSFRNSRLTRQFRLADYEETGSPPKQREEVDPEPGNIGNSYSWPSNGAIALPEHGKVQDDLVGLCLYVHLRNYPLQPSYKYLEKPQAIYRPPDSYIHLFCNGVWCTSRYVPCSPIPVPGKGSAEIFHGIRVGKRIEKAWIVKARKHSRLQSHLNIETAAHSVQRWTAINIKLLDTVKLRSGSFPPLAYLSEYVTALQTVPPPQSVVRSTGPSVAVIDVIIVNGRLKQANSVKRGVEPSSSFSIPPKQSTQSEVSSGLFKQRNTQAPVHGSAPISVPLQRKPTSYHAGILTRVPTPQRTPAENHRSTARPPILTSGPSSLQAPKKSQTLEIIQIDASTASRQAPAVESARKSAKRSSTYQSRLRGGWMEFGGPVGKPPDTKDDASYDAEDEQDFVPVCKAQEHRDDPSAGGAVRQSYTIDDSHHTHHESSRRTLSSVTLQNARSPGSGPGKEYTGTMIHGDTARNGPTKIMTELLPRQSSEQDDLYEIHPRLQQTRDLTARFLQQTLPTFRTPEREIDSDATEAWSTPSRNLVTSYYPILRSVTARSVRPASSIAQFAKQDPRLHQITDYDSEATISVDLEPCSDPSRLPHVQQNANEHDFQDSDSAPPEFYTSTSDETRARRSLKPSMKQPRAKRRFFYRSSDFDSEDAVATLPVRQSKKIKVVSRNEKPVLPQSALPPAKRPRERKLSGPRSNLVRPQPKQGRGLKKSVKHFSGVGPTEREMLRWVRSQARVLDGVEETPATALDIPESQDQYGSAIGINSSQKEANSAWETFLREKKVAENKENHLHEGCAVIVSEDVLRPCKDDLLYPGFVSHEIASAIRYVIG